MTAHIPHPTKSWRTVSGGCSTLLSFGQLSPYLLLCPNLNCSFLLICFSASLSVMLFWLLTPVTEQTMMTEDKLQPPASSEVLLGGGNKMCWQMKMILGSLASDRQNISGWNIEFIQAKVQEKQKNNLYWEHSLIELVPVGIAGHSSFDPVHSWWATAQGNAQKSGFLGDNFMFILFWESKRIL